jgi:hypothetical protein
VRQVGTIFNFRALGVEIASKKFFNIVIHFYGSMIGNCKPCTPRV